MTHDARYRRTDGVVWRRAGPSVLVDGRAGPLRLSGAAALVWLDLDAPASVHELWTASTGAPSEALVAAGVGELVRNGLVLPVELDVSSWT